MRRSELQLGRLALTALVPITACGGDGGTEPNAAATISVWPPAVELSSLGESFQMTATVRDQDGQEIAGAPLNWSSNDNSVATIDASGLVTSIQNGSAIVTAASGSASGTASITVAQRLAQFRVSPASSRLSSLGDTLRLVAEALDAAGSDVAGIDITWRSGDDGVATVDATGLVTAKANGTVKITAQGGGMSGTAEVTIAQLAVRLNVVPAAFSLLALGDTLRLMAFVLDVNDNEVAGTSFEWTSKNDAVASVDASGLVTAVRTGSTDVFAASGDLSDSAGVTIAQLATKVRVTPATDTLVAVGDTVRLSAVAIDRNGNEVEDTDYIWSAPQPEVVTVSDDGLVTAVGPGTGEIHVKATRAGANHIGVTTIYVLGSSARESGAGPTGGAEQALALTPRASGRTPGVHGVGCGGC
ncbi:MAG: Ig-like domain-containing protein [Gemmatimonadota bacterium]|nr:Ig-like domain-containing protein [Gemmatimonadota bacterium]